MADTTSNILITTNDNTAIMATDYGTSGTGLSLAHVSLAKIAYGDGDTTTRVDTATPLPIYIYGATGTTFPVSGTLGGTGTYFVRNETGTVLLVEGNTGGRLLGVTGAIQGLYNGYPVGVTGSLTVPNIIRIEGTTSGMLVGVTGGRQLTSALDSVTIVGSVSLSGLTLSAATHSIACWGADLDDKVSIKLYSSDGVTLGHESDALKVHVVNSGITFSVNISATVGVTNATGPLGLMVQGTGNTAANPIIIQGTALGGAMEIVSYDELAVSIAGTVTIDDTNLINSLESATNPLISNLAAIRTNTNTISLINDALNVGSISARVIDTARSNAVWNGKKTVTTVPGPLTIPGQPATTLKCGVNVKTSSRNTDIVFIGNSSLVAQPTNGYPLEPGESIFIECNNYALIFCKANSGSQTVHFIAS